MFVSQPLAIGTVSHIAETLHLDHTIKCLQLTTADTHRAPFTEKGPLTAVSLCTELEHRGEQVHHSPLSLQTQTLTFLIKLTHLYLWENPSPVSQSALHKPIH